MPLKTRTQTPPSYADYRSYKQFLRIEFNHQCAYCEIREAEDGGSQKFHIDHYKPKNHFPLEINIYSNLFYCCSTCNCFKGSFWPTFIQKFLGKFILNPCDHDFDKNYDRMNAEWEAKSKTATWNIDRLRLNAPKIQQIRKDRAHFIKFLAELETQKLKLQDLLKNTQHKDIKQENNILEDLEYTQEKIDTIRRKTDQPLD